MDEKKPGPVVEHALAHMTIAANEMASLIQPAEMAALSRIDEVIGQDNLVPTILATIVGFLVSKGLSPEEIGDATTAMARIVNQ